MPLSPSIVFITGVHTGLGHGFAEEYLERGATVLGTSRNAPADLLEHPNFSFEVGDLTKPEDVTQLVARLARRAESAPLDLAILNAGILGPLEDMANQSMDDLRRVMEINVWANKQLLDALFQHFEAVRQVVTISSGASVNGNRGWGGYSISKAALNMLTLLYAREQTDCHFCPLAPGLIDTPMQDEICEGPSDPRFPSRDRLRAKRNTPDMPPPREAARQISEVIERLPRISESGEFVDVRNLPEA